MKQSGYFLRLFFVGHSNTNTLLKVQAVDSWLAMPSNHLPEATTDFTLLQRSNTLGDTRRRRIKPTLSFTYAKIQIIVLSAICCGQRHDNFIGMCERATVEARMLFSSPLPKWKDTNLTQAPAADSVLLTARKKYMHVFKGVGALCK